MPTFYIIRHAAKEKEKGDFRVPGLPHQDQPLSEKGWEQARKLWSYLCDKEIKAIYVSQYQRTAQTVDYVAQQLGLTPVMDKRLNEIDIGVVGPMSDAEVQEQFPEFWKAYNERTADFRFPGGESGEDACRRISEFLEEKRLAHPDENVLVISHDGIIRQLMAHLMGLPVYQRDRFYIDLCGIMEITYDAQYKHWELVRFNHILS